MKKLITIILIIISVAGFAQLKISNPKIMLDTTIGSSRFIFSWNGEGKMLIMDSIWYDSVSHVNPDYISVMNSHYRVQIVKQRIVAGDTLGRMINMDIPFVDIVSPVSTFFGSNTLKKQIKKALKTEYKKKLSAE